jgi:uncharacterized protein YabE (DUF348 family)
MVVKASASVLALALIGAGFLGWLTTDRTVTVTVDGAARIVHTHARTVAGLLRQAGVAASSRDEVVPEPAAAVTEGMEVLVERGREVTVLLDGQPRRFWTTARNLDSAVSDLGIRAARLKLSASRSARVPLVGGRFEIRTEKSVTVVADGRHSRVGTYAVTVAELLGERGLRLAPADQVVPVLSAVLTDGAVIRVSRIVRRAATITASLPAPLIVQADPSLMLDQERTIETGRAGLETRTQQDVYADGRLVSTQILTREVITAPGSRVVVRGTKAYPPDTTGRDWAALARCESGGRASVVSAGGSYHGLYQFSVGTWQRVGGIGLPSQATVREQTYRAILLYQRSGAGQWPNCGRLL